MAVYILGQPEAYALAGLDYAQVYGQTISGETDGPVRYVCTELLGQGESATYKKAGIGTEQILGIHSYFTDNHNVSVTAKAEDKLEELRHSFRFTDIDRRNSEIRLIKDGYVVAAILLDAIDKDRFWGIHYYSYTKLLRMEVYTDQIAYANYYVTAKSENGLYAKLVRRCFYNRDASVAYEHIFEGEKERYLFPDGRRYTRPQFIAEFVRKLNLTAQDRVILDASVSPELMQAIFTFGKGARITAIAHAGCYFEEKESRCQSLLKGYPCHWFPYAEMLDRMVVSTETQKKALVQELEKYHCRVPDIRVITVEGEFTYTVLKESYDGNLALSWNFSGKQDGFQIYNEAGEKMYETWNRHQHYYLIKGYGKESGFVVKAYVDTVKGKEIIGESESVYLQARSYGKPLVSLIIPAYNAEDYIARTMDNALAQSLSDVEIVVVDDGSTDATPGILDWYAERYSNVVVIHQENGGASTARNAGIKSANGSYMEFMDSDDMIHPDMIARLYNSIEENSCDVVISSSYQITNAGYIPVTQYPMEENVVVPIDEFFDKYFVKGHGYAFLCNKLYRASLVKTHLFPMLLAEDDAWNLYILSYADKICYLNGHLYEWDRTIRKSTLSDKIVKRSKDELFKLYKEAVLFYMKNGNPNRRDTLKKLAKTHLLLLEKYNAYDEYGKLWKQIEETF
ncbi:MAG: glycosyltransferase [Lachnospiraceae bacterium]|nr:glycosyltransferase [Lachnospiraceae bacterium]